MLQCTLASYMPLWPVCSCNVDNKGSSWQKYASLRQIGLVLFCTHVSTCIAWTDSTVLSCHRWYHMMHCIVQKGEGSVCNKLAMVSVQTKPTILVTVDIVMNVLSSIYFSMAWTFFRFFSNDTVVQLTVVNTVQTAICFPGSSCLKVVAREIGGTTARLFHCSGSDPTCIAWVEKWAYGTKSPQSPIIYYRRKYVRFPSKNELRHVR